MVAKGAAQWDRNEPLKDNQRQHSHVSTNRKLSLDETQLEDHQEHDDKNKNLDSGYAWLILVIMFLLQSSISGASRVYGIVYAKEVSIGYYDREQASWPIATSSAIENLASILTPALASHLSWRQIELLSTSLFILSNLLAYFSSTLAVDIIALGLIQGLALSTYTVLSLVINNDYFERYRTTAYGISMSGSTFGVLYLSPLVSWILREYENFRLVYLALAIVFCANVFLVLFIKPRRETIKSRKLPLSEGDSLQRAESNHEMAYDTDIERARRVLETLNRDQKLGNQLKEPPPRKLSRFESHFERKNSIASISYEARSRRHSILSRKRVSVVAANDRAQGPYSIDITPQAAVAGGQWAKSARSLEKNIILKSKSGLELATSCGGYGGGDSTITDGGMLQKQGVCLNSIRSSPTIAQDHQLAASENEHAKRQQSKLSMTDSLNSLTNNHLLQSRLALNTSRDSLATKCDNNEHSSLDLKESRYCSGGAEIDEDESKQNKYSPAANDDGSMKLDVKDLEKDANERYDDLSSTPAYILQNKRQFLVNRSTMEPNDCKTIPALKQKGQQTREDNDGSFSMDQTVKFLKVPYLHCTWIMLALYYLIARVFVIILVDFADDHGFTMSESTQLLNYWSIGELVGRIFLGPFIDLQYMSCKNCIVLTCSLLASCIVLMVLVESYIVYTACSMSIAALISLEYMLINVLMVEYLGKENVSKCYSLAACISSIVLFARPSMIGFFRDHLGSYDGLLILLASLATVFALVFYILEPILVRKWPKKQYQ